MASPAATSSASVKDLPTVHKARWRQDLSAGLTNGILSVPQGIAFAVLAQIPPIYGVMAMIFPVIVGSAIHRSPYVMFGATTTSALVVGIMSYSLAPKLALSPIAVMLLIVLAMAMIQIAFSIMKLGSIGRFVSNPVLLGFTAGAATLIAVGQIKYLLGVKMPSSSSVFGELYNLKSAMNQIQFPALALALGTIFGVFICERISKLIPGPLLAVFACGICVSIFELEVACIGAIPRQLPEQNIFKVLNELSVTQFISNFGAILGSAFALAILGMVETISIGKALSMKIKSQRAPFEADRELLALGSSNLVSSFLGGLPSSASWTRSAVNVHFEAQTRWVGLIAGLMVLAIVLPLAPLAQYIPEACLGGIIVYVAFKMFDLQAMRQICRWSRADGFVMLLSLAATLLFPIQYAIYLGIFVSLLLLVRRVGHLHLVELAQTGLDRYRETPIDEVSGNTPIVLLQLEGDLFFGIVDELDKKLRAIAEKGIAKAIVIRLKRAHSIDATTANALAEFSESFKKRGGRLLFVGLQKELHRKMLQSRLGEIAGPELLLLSTEQAYESVLNGIELAKRHVTAPQTEIASEPLIRRATSNSIYVLNFEI